MQIANYIYVMFYYVLCFIMGPEICGALCMCARRLDRQDGKMREWGAAELLDEKHLWLHIM